MTVTGPVTTPAGAVTEMDVSLEAEGVTAMEPLEPAKVTEVRGEKLVPAMVTAVPATPASGESEVMIGVKTVKPALLAPVPDEAVTEIEPVRALEGTVAVIWVVLSTV